jgi:hypothetical protein
LRTSALILATVLATAGAAASGVTVATHSNPAPQDIAEPVRAALAAGGATATVGGTAIEFWWVKSLDAKGKDWSTVAEGALVGAMKVAAAFKDIRGRTLQPGTYLLRFALQPQNGDHLGVSPTREFLLATPAAADTSPAALGHEPTVELAARTLNIKHPAVFMIDPPAAAAAPLSLVQNDLGHTAVVFEVPTAGGTPLRFGLVLAGHIEA